MPIKSVAAKKAPAKTATLLKTPAAKKAAATPDTPAKPFKPKSKEAPLPKTTAGCADELYTLTQERSVLARQVEAMKSREHALREHLIATLPKSNATGVAGKLARVYVESKPVYGLKDFDKLMGYVVANYKKNPGVAALLQRRISDGTAKEMMEAGTKIPGVEVTDIPVVRMNKVG